MKICVPILAKTTQKAIDEISSTQKIKNVDLIEIWCGEIKDLDLKKIFAIKKLPFVLNCKGKDEKGSFNGSENEKLKILLEGAKFGAEYCDLSVNTTNEIFQNFIKNKQKTKLIISEHFWKNTPNLPALLNTIDKMKKLGAEIFKIASFTKTSKDLVTIMRLAENLQRKNMRHIIIGMGDIGSISRFLMPKFFAGEFTFAPIKKALSNAPGQISIEELKKIDNIFK